MPERRFIHPHETRPEGTFSSLEVCEMTGATYRQLNVWIAGNLIPGQGPLSSGRCRVWTQEQVDRAQEIHDTLAKVLHLLRSKGLDGHARMFDGRGKGRAS